MKILKGVLLIFVITSCFFLCRVSNVFALFRDDISPEKAREMIRLEREKSKVRWQEKETERQKERQRQKQQAGERKRQIEEDPLQGAKAIAAAAAKKKQIPSLAAGPTKSAPSRFGEKMVIGLALLGLAIVVAIGYRKGKK